MPTINYSRTASGLGSVQTLSSKLKTPIGVAFEISVPKGKVGSLTTRSTDVSGVITLTAGHGLVSGTYDIYWSTGQLFNCDVTIVGNEATFFANYEDLNLDLDQATPDEGTAVVVSTPVTFDFPFQADLVQFMVAEAVLANRSVGIRAGLWSGNDSMTNDSLAAWPLQSGRVDERDFTQSDQLVWSGNQQEIQTWFFSHGSSIQDCTFKMLFMCDPLNVSSS